MTTKTEFKSFQQAVITRTNEFDEHWQFMNRIDPVEYPKLLTYEDWFDRLLDYVSDNVNSN